MFGGDIRGFVTENSDTGYFSERKISKYFNPLSYCKKRLVLFIFVIYFLVLCSNY